MAKKNNSTSTGTPAADASNKAASLADLKSAGNTAFAKKEYAKAIQSWNAALKISTDPTESAILHNNKAACHIVNKRYKEAVAECDAALQAQPEYFKALVRRAKALEALGDYKNALTDVQKANKLEQVTEESKQTERRLKELVAGKRPAGVAGKGLGGGGRGSLAGAKKGATAGGSTAGSTGRQAIFPAKLQYGSDTRSISLSPTMTYSELLASAKEIFPAAYPFALKYLDKEGDLVTITQKGDLQMAMSQSYETAHRSAGNRALTAANLPPVRIQVVKVASEAEVPKAPLDENRQLQNYLEQLQRMQRMQQQQQQQQQQGEVPEFQVDPWILKFVDLFREHCGIDPDRPLEAAEIGNSKLTAAFQEMMDQPKAEELLCEAEDKFHEQVASAMICQAAVHHYRAERLMFAAAKAGKPASDITKEVEQHLKKAEEQCKAAIAYRPVFYDAYLTEAAVAQTRAKLAANYLVEPQVAKEDDATTDPAQKAAAEEKEGKDILKKALARVTPASSKAADKYFEVAYAHIQKAIDNLSKEDANKEIKHLKPSGEQDPADPEDQPSVKATLLIQMGNAYYEHSVVRAAGGGDWKSLVLKSKDLFEKAGAHPMDIRVALQGHVMAEELADMIGPDPEPEPKPKPAPAAANGKEAAAPKGLPALSKKK